MKFAVLAAGEGSRLSSEGVSLPKPLVRVCGEAMIDRLLRIFSRQGADEIVVIVNQLTDLVKQHIEQNYNHILSDGSLRECRSGKPLVSVPVRLVAKTTPSSMHSLYAIREYLRSDTFCLTTVDTIFRESEFAGYVARLRQSAADGVMGVTAFVDDEKPLYVAARGDGEISAFSDTKEDCGYVSGGIYGLRPAAIDVLERCIDQGLSRMRNFQRALIADGMRLEAYPFTKIIDVDHAGDVAKAEQFLNGDE